MGRLVFKRKIGESIMVGDEVEITVVEIDGRGMRLSILAPKEIRVHRREVWQRIQAEGERGTAKTRAAEAAGGS